MTQEEIVALANKAGLREVKLSKKLQEMRDQQLEKFAALVAAAEREREECAKVCESHIDTPGQFLPFVCACYIRARGTA